MKSKLITLPLIISTALLLGAPVFAQTQTPTGTPPGQNQANLTADRLAKLKAKANAEIDRRLTALTKLQNLIVEVKKLTEADRTALQTQVQAETTSLSDLRMKVGSETEIAALRNDIQTLVKDYRIFALFVPKIHIFVAADRLNTVADSLAQIAVKLQTRLSEAKAAGKATTALETALADMQAKIADAKVQTAAAFTAVTVLTPEGYPGNRTQLQSAQAQIKTALTDLNKARQDAKTIVQGLKDFGTTATPTATPTP